MKIGIIGLGPIGLISAIHLQEAGNEVGICDIDKSKIDLIRKEGIFLEGTITKTATFDNVYSSVKELILFNPELLIFSIKSHHISSVLNQLELNEGQPDNPLPYVISAQNGIDTEKPLAKAFGLDKTLRMVINFASNLNAPNIANVTFFNPPNYIASLDGSAETIANQFAIALTKVGLETIAVDSDEIIKEVWHKTILNASLSALCGLTNLTMKEVMEKEGTVEIVKQTLDESIKVAEAKGIHFGDDFLDICLGYLKKTGNHLPSLADDLLHNRITEIDYFNGKIVEYGKKHSIPTHLNLAFTNMIKAITSKNLKSGNS